MAKVENKTVISVKLSDDSEVINFSLNELGWVGVDRDSAEFKKKRQYLSANNGIEGLEIVVPEEVERATRIFYRDGFVVVRDVLDTDQLDKNLPGGCNNFSLRSKSTDGNSSPETNTALPSTYFT